MTVSWALATITNSIAAISVSGVTIKDIDQLSGSFKVSGPTLYPRPDGFVSDVSLTRETSGGGATAKWTLTYTLTYRYLHCLVGNVNTLLDSYAAMLAKVVLIANAFVTEDDPTGAVDMSWLGLSDLGPVMDPAGNIYHGCDLLFRVTEFQN